jgi:hypothetical protein
MAKPRAERDGDSIADIRGANDGNEGTDRRSVGPAFRREVDVY